MNPRIVVEHKGSRTQAREEKKRLEQKTKAEEQKIAKGMEVNYQEKG